jgi:ribosomal protein S18 acetylase RimI-like enzyme
VEVTIREAVPADWQEAGRICYEAFATLAARHGFPPDFPTVEAAAEPIKWLIGHPRIYGVVAEKAGRILGSNFLDERSSISAMGPISVDPATQDRNVGRMLTQAALAQPLRQAGLRRPRLVRGDARAAARAEAARLRGSGRDRRRRSGVQCAVPPRPRPR